MENKIDYSIATSSQIEEHLCRQLEKIRLTLNMTQPQLANESGVGVRTIKRLEKGQGVSMDTFIRVLIALKLQQNLAVLLPDPAVRPVERVNYRGKERKRARPVEIDRDKGPWSWGDEKGEKS